MKDHNEKVAFREHIVTDQGNGGSYCSNCRNSLDNDVYLDYCPFCLYKLLEGSMYVNWGGSDF